MDSSAPSDEAAPAPDVQALQGLDRQAPTAQHLVGVARDLFTERGYAATSLDTVVAGADVTKGALYHHFDGKRALFAAVHRDVEDEAVRRLDEATASCADPWDAASAGLRAFLEIAREPAYRRVIIQDGPAVLGAGPDPASGRSTFATVRRLVDATLTSGPVQVPEALVETFSRIVFGAMHSAGATVATSDTPQEEAALVEASVGLLLAALRRISSDPDSLRAAVAPFLEGTDRA